MNNAALGVFLGIIGAIGLAVFSYLLTMLAGDALFFYVGVLCVPLIGFFKYKKGKKYFGVTMMVCAIPIWILAGIFFLLSSLH